MESVKEEIKQLIDSINNMFVLEQIKSMIKLIMKD